MFSLRHNSPYRNACVALPIVILILLLNSDMRCAAAPPSGAPEVLNGQWNLGGAAQGSASLQIQPDGVLHISVQKPGLVYWDVQVMQTISAAVPKDDRLLLTFRARSPDSNSMRVEVEQMVKPYNSAAELTTAMQPDWKEYKIEGVSPGFGAGGLGVHFQIGRQAGTVELADIHLSDLGVDPAMQQASAAIEPAAIAERIDRYRKRTLKLHIVDAVGKAIAGAHVDVAQTRHAFLFGCNIFELKPDETDTIQIQYQQRFAALFNYATLPFYWGSYETERGHPNESRLLAMARWCHEHQITAKGHPLVYHLVYPKWAPIDAATTIPLLHARIDQIVKRFGGLINIWDVINEANSTGGQKPNGVSDWIERDGAFTVVGTVLRWARQADANHRDTFLYNDYNLAGTNLALLQNLADHHELPDAIGIQSHMHPANWDLRKIWVTAEHFAVFGKPIHFTETTILSGEHRNIPNAPGPNATDWDSTPAGEKEQAEYVAKFYSILFSHPAVRAITWWDFSDHNAWLGAPSGLLRKDMSPKPAYEALMKLIRHDWWTRTQLTSDAGGDCDVRAFCGDYVVTITDDGGHKSEKQVSLPMAATEDDSDVSIQLTTDW